MGRLGIPYMTYIREKEYAMKYSFAWKRSMDVGWDRDREHLNLKFKCVRRKWESEVGLEWTMVELRKMMWLREKRICQRNKKYAWLREEGKCCEGKN